MDRNSSDQISQSQNTFERKEGALAKNHYFDNELVERLLYDYLESACTDVVLRNAVMVQAEELIRQIIKAHNLGQIYPGREESSVMDLFQTAWLQIESALYKYEARPHCDKCYNIQRPNDSVLTDEFMMADDVLKKIGKCPKCNVRLERVNIYYKGKSKVFNMWSQIARTVILAYIKKENRDRKNSPVFQVHLENRVQSKSEALDRWIIEAEEMCKYNDEHLKILKTIKKLHSEDEKPNEGFIAKLVMKSGLSRATVTDFLKFVRLRSHDFSDSPMNEENETKRRKDVGDDHDDDSM